MRLRNGLSIVLFAICALCTLPLKMNAQTVSVRNSNWFFSPYNWYLPGVFSINGFGAQGLSIDEMVTTQPGAYFTLNFTNSANATLNLDLLGVPAFSSGATTIVVQWSVDGVLAPSHTITTSDSRLLLASGLGGGAHTIQFWILSSDYHQDRWSKSVTMANGFAGPAQSLRVLGMQLDPGATVTAPALRPKRILFYGDSITEGAVASPADDATQTYAVVCARLLNAEYGVIAHPGQGWATNIAPTTGVPDFAHAFGLHYAQTPRFPLSAGTPAPDYVVVNMGTNDGIAGSLPSLVTANTLVALQQIRNYLPNTRIYLTVPFGGFEYPALLSAYSQYAATHQNDANVKLLNLGPTAQTGLITQIAGGNSQSYDGIHPNVATQRALGFQLTAAIRTAQGFTDFNGDGKSDLILQNTASNQIGAWFQNGPLQLGNTLLSNIPALVWQIVGSGDFNGDGKPDYVFQNTTTGQIAFWFMDGVTPLGNAIVAQIPSLGYKAVAVGDFNGDGKPDIVFQNTFTNQIAFWLMDGSQLIGGASLSQVPGAGYSVVGAADFDRDGQLDLLFQSSVTGAMAIWHMAGVQYLSGVSVSVAPPLGYRVEAVADFDGDGRPDAVLRSPLGDVVIWHLDDGKAYQTDVVSTRLDTAFRIVGPR